MGMKKNSGDTRRRNFATVVYPESAPDNWLDILSDLHIPAFVSPLHDSDVTGTGEAKKAHWHVMLMFEGKKSIEQVQEYVSSFGGVGLEVVNTIRGYARYLCHLDDPNKAQYPIENVTSICGADYTGTIGLALDKYKAIGEMIDFCEENNIVSYSELLIYCRNNRFDWFKVLCDNGTIVMKEFLKSKQWSESTKVVTRHV